QRCLRFGKCQLLGEGERQRMRERGKRKPVDARTTRPAGPEVAETADHLIDVMGARASNSPGEDHSEGGSSADRSRSGKRESKPARRYVEVAPRRLAESSPLGACRVRMRAPHRLLVKLRHVLGPD